jgi:membrane-bound inhibitor of C-type lysozyme
LLIDKEMSTTRTIIYGIIALVIIILVLWWASSTINTPNAPQVSSRQSNNVAIYVCPSGNDVKAAFNSDSTVTVRTMTGNSMHLNQTRSADGGRYANKEGSFVFWDKGRYAMITRTDTTETCINKNNLAKVRADKQAIKKVVSGFGSRLQRVSLLASDASHTIAQVYAPYVTPQLLSQWTKDPSDAPGRTTSSPWPDHFIINHIQPSGVGYMVNATLVLMTSNEIEHGGNAGTKNVQMMLTKRKGKWRILSYDG